MKYFDLHCDTMTECCLRGAHLDKNSLHVSIDGARGYEKWVQVFAAWIPDDLRGEAAFRRYRRIYSYFLGEKLRCGDSLCFCRGPEETESALQNNRNTALLSIEGGAALAGDIGNLGRVRADGVRILTLTWNGSCELGDGCMVKNAGGLTAFGREVVKRSAGLGVTVDVSHLSDKGFEDAAKASDAPFIASHSNSRAVCGHPRNLTDDEIREICRRGGLIGLNFYKYFISPGGDKGLEYLVRHAEKILSLGGERTLAVGADLDGAEIPDGVGGIAGAARLHSLLSAEFGAQQADRIFFGNAADFFRKF